MELARERGYQTVCLRTRPQMMPHAQPIYREVGFQRAAGATARGTDGPMTMVVTVTDAAAVARLAT